jgi:predicted dienelactone hydrolase
MTGLAILSLLSAAYDPMALPAGWTPKPIDMEMTDADRSREIPLRVWLPAAKGAPVVLFSHGLGGARVNNPYLGEHWSARGYAVVQMQHVGSDESVWKGKRPAQIMSAMQAAATGDNYVQRVRDVEAVLDQLSAWNSQSGHTLEDRLDLKRVGMSGHSFGALTTQAVSGQSAPGLGQAATDPRILAALPMSPSLPARGGASSFSQVSIPWLLMTGTKDDSPIGDTSPEERTKVYPALPSTIDRYQINLWEATHGAFGQADRARNLGGRNPNHHRVILALSTAFWDAYLMKNAEAKAWLQGPAARSVMEEKDDWKVGLAQN